MVGKDTQEVPQLLETRGERRDTKGDGRKGRRNQVLAEQHLKYSQYDCISNSNTWNDLQKMTDSRNSNLFLVTRHPQHLSPSSTASPV